MDNAEIEAILKETFEEGEHVKWRGQSAPYKLLQEINADLLVDCDRYRRRSIVGLYILCVEQRRAVSAVCIDFHHRISDTGFCRPDPGQDAYHQAGIDHHQSPRVYLRSCASPPCQYRAATPLSW